jgi:hypothetical protein
LKTLPSDRMEFPIGEDEAVLAALERLGHPRILTLGPSSAAIGRTAHMQKEESNADSVHGYFVNLDLGIRESS